MREKAMSVSTNSPFSPRSPLSKGPLRRLILRFVKPFAKCRQIPCVCCFVVVRHIRDVALSPWKDSTCRSIKRVKPLFPPNVAGENSRFPSRFATEEVSLGKTSGTRRQKFHTDDVKSVQSEALIGGRSTYIVLAIVYDWQTKHKRPRRWNVNETNL